MSEEHQQLKEEGAALIAPNGARYVKGVPRTIWGKITDLEAATICTSAIYQSRDGAQDWEPRLLLRGCVHLKKDDVAIIGSSVPPARRIALTLKPSSDEPKPGHAFIGFHPEDWETDVRPEWWMEAWVPSATFTLIWDSLEAGRIDNIAIGLRTEFWVLSGDQYAPPSSHVRWYLPPEKSGSPESVMGEAEITSMMIEHNTARSPAAMEEVTPEAPSERQPAAQAPQAPAQPLQLVSDKEAVAEIRSVARTQRLIAGTLIIAALATLLR